MIVWQYDITAWLFPRSSNILYLVAGLEECNCNSTLDIWHNLEIFNGEVFPWNLTPPIGKSFLPRKFLTIWCNSCIFLVMLCNVTWCYTVRCQLGTFHLGLSMSEPLLIFLVFTNTHTHTHTQTPLMERNGGRSPAVSHMAPTWSNTYAKNLKTTSQFV